MKFWKEIWETQGDYEPEQPTLMSWKRGVKDQIGEGTDREYVTREQAWVTALGKLSNWKAPGLKFQIITMYSHTLQTHYLPPHGVQVANRDNCSGTDFSGDQGGNTPR